MSNPSHPTVLDLPAGTHSLCTCGLSQNGHFCDGSHQCSGKTPHILKLDAPQTVFACNCGATGNSPFCDGSHTKLSVAPAAQRPWWKFWG